MAETRHAKTQIAQDRRRAKSERLTMLLCFRSTEDCKENHDPCGPFPFDCGKQHLPQQSATTTQDLQLTQPLEVKLQELMEEGKGFGASEDSEEVKEEKAVEIDHDLWEVAKERAFQMLSKQTVGMPCAEHYEQSLPFDAVILEEDIVDDSSYSDGSNASTGWTDEALPSNSVDERLLHRETCVGYCPPLQEEEENISEEDSLLVEPRKTRYSKGAGEGETNLHTLDEEEEGEEPKPPQPLYSCDRTPSWAPTVGIFQRAAAPTPSFNSARQRRMDLAKRHHLVHRLSPELVEETRAQRTFSASESRVALPPIVEAPSSCSCSSGTTHSCQI